MGLKLVAAAALLVAFVWALSPAQVWWLIVPSVGFGAAIVVALAVLWSMFRARPRPQALVDRFRTDWTGKTTGHRGLSIPGLSVPENSLPAFMCAKQLGAFAVECDVMLTGDDEIAVIHDMSLHRVLRGVGYTSQMSQSELEKLEYRYPPMTVTESARVNEKLFQLADAGQPLPANSDPYELLSEKERSPGMGFALPSPRKVRRFVRKLCQVHALRAEVQAHIPKPVLQNTSSGSNQASDLGGVGAQDVSDCASCHQLARIPFDAEVAVDEDADPQAHITAHAGAVLEGRGAQLVAEVLTGVPFLAASLLEPTIGHARISLARPQSGPPEIVERPDGEALVLIPEPAAGPERAAQATVAAAVAGLDDWHFDTHDHNHPQHRQGGVGAEPLAELLAQMDYHDSADNRSQHRKGDTGVSAVSPSELLVDASTPRAREEEFKERPRAGGIYEGFEKHAAIKAAVSPTHSPAVSPKAAQLDFSENEQPQQVRFELPADLLGNWTRVPTLRRLLRMCWRLDMRLIIEIKEIYRVKDMIDRLVALLDEWDAECLELARAKGVPDWDYPPSVTHVLVASFDPRNLFVLRRQRPLIPICLLYCAGLGQWIMDDNSEGVHVPKILRKLRWLITLADLVLEHGSPYLVAPFLECDMVSAHSVLLSPHLIAHNTRHGRVTGAWTVNSYLERDWLQSQGVCVTTDRCFYPKHLLTIPVPEAQVVA